MLDDLGVRDSGEAESVGEGLTLSVASVGTLVKLGKVSSSTSSGEIASASSLLSKSALDASVGNSESGETKGDEGRFHF